MTLMNIFLKIKISHFNTIKKIIKFIRKTFKSNCKKYNDTTIWQQYRDEINIKIKWYFFKKFTIYKQIKEVNVIIRMIVVSISVYDKNLFIIDNEITN